MGRAQIFEATCLTQNSLSILFRMVRTNSGNFWPELQIVVRFGECGHLELRAEDSRAFN